MLELAPVGVDVVAAAPCGGCCGKSCGCNDIGCYSFPRVAMVERFAPAVFHHTTVIGVLRDGKAAMGADGQVTMGQTVLKQTARKVRRLYNERILAGFSGATADAMTLLQRFEEKLESNRGHLLRAAIELAKEWRTDRYLRHLEAMLLVMNTTQLLLISGTGDVVEPDDRVAAIGSGGAFALAAARALLQHTELSARQIVEESLRIASGICIYTNDVITVEELS